MRLKPITYNLKPQRGFTLIEAVVATSVFAFVIVSILGVYLSALQLDKKTRSQRAATQNARFIAEFLAKEIRNGTIDYSSYPDINSTTNLYLVNQAGASEHFWLNGTDLQLTNSSGGPTNLNSSSIKVTKLAFYLSPKPNPYTSAKLSNEHPRVTMILELSANYGDRAIDRAVINLETTFTTRNYPSRQ